MYTMATKEKSWRKASGAPGTGFTRGGMTMKCMKVVHRMVACSISSRCCTNLRPADAPVKPHPPPHKVGMQVHITYQLALQQQASITLALIVIEPCFALS